MSTDIYKLEVEDRRRQPDELEFGARSIAGPTAYPLGLLPLVRAFYAVEGARVIAQKHNANLVPPWEKTRAAIQITQHSEAHHGDVVVMRIPYGTSAQVDLEVAGVRVFSRKGQKGIASISMGAWAADDMRDAYRASIAMCRALILIGADGATIWRDIEAQLLRQLDEVEAEWDETIMHHYSAAIDAKSEAGAQVVQQERVAGNMSTSAPGPITFRYID